MGERLGLAVFRLLAARLQRVRESLKKMPALNFPELRQTF